MFDTMALDRATDCPASSPDLSEVDHHATGGASVAVAVVADGLCDLVDSFVAWRQDLEDSQRHLRGLLEPVLAPESGLHSAVAGPRSASEYAEAGRSLNHPESESSYPPEVLSADLAADLAAELPRHFGGIGVDADDAIYFRLSAIALVDALKKLGWRLSVVGLPPEG